jgi:multidrug resistance efflux pump
MQTPETKKIVISLPHFHWKFFLSARFALVLILFLLTGGFAYWFQNVRPYLKIANAQINAYASVIGTEVTGRIAEMGPQEGDRVKKGSLLFSFDRESILAKYNQVRSRFELLKSQADYEIAQAMEGYMAATNEFERGIGDSETLQNSVKLLEEAQSKSEEMLLKKEALQKELSLLEGELKKGAFFAPFEGVILKRYRNEGSVCSVGDPVYTLCDLDRAWVEAQIPEAHLRKISIGTIAKVHINAYPSQEFNGRVVYIGNATAFKSDQLSREGEGTIPIKIFLDDKTALLKPGLSAKVALKVH